MKSVCKTIFLGLSLVAVMSCSDSEQQADPDFVPKNIKKTFSQSNSPVVFIDEAHNNFLTKMVDTSLLHKFCLVMVIRSNLVMKSSL